MQETASYFNFTAPELPDIEALLTDGMHESKVKCRVCYHNEITSIEFERYVPNNLKSLKLINMFPDYSFKFSNRKAIDDLLKFRNGCDDILIVRNGLITDTSYSNVVFRKDNMYFTPNFPLLNGTKRQKLLENKIIEEAVINVETIKQYDRVWLINALLDIEDDVSLSVEQIFE
ncbi:MAG TPA: hypothetical protein GX712_07230 [Bacteroidales bacterium]|nr:hypothetical protein [Bacteroidales bacterium]